MDLFDKFENKESNGEIKEIVKDEIMFENVNTSVTKEVITDPNGIVGVRYGNEIYRTWKVEFIRPFIYSFLKERCPSSLLVREVNDIDVTVFNKKSNRIVPVEIQKSILDMTSRKESRFRHTHFENMIRKQIEENIRDYDMCWFFMDSEYLRYLQDGSIGKKTSVNLTWLIKLMREETLKVFSIKYDGFVRELAIKDFDFLEKLHSSDEIILNKNKLKIYQNVLYGHNFTQEEISEFESEFDKRIDRSKEMCSSNFFKISDNERCKLYGFVRQALGNLSGINMCLDMNNDDSSDKRNALNVGIFEIVGNCGNGNYVNHMKFVDKFDICKYFPGYLRQEKHWLTYKGNEMDGRTFSNMCRGFYKNTATIFDY